MYLWLQSTVIEWCMCGSPEHKLLTHFPNIKERLIFIIWNVFSLLPGKLNSIQLKYEKSCFLPAWMSKILKTFIDTAKSSFEIMSGFRFSAWGVTVQDLYPERCWTLWCPSKCSLMCRQKVIFVTVYASRRSRESWLGTRFIILGCFNKLVSHDSYQMLKRFEGRNGEAPGSGCVITLLKVGLYKISKIFLSINLSESNTDVETYPSILVMQLKSKTWTLLNQWGGETCQWSIDRLIMSIKHW